MGTDDFEKPDESPAFSVDKTGMFGTGTKSPYDYLQKADK